VFDLVGGTEGRSQVLDEAGNSTTVDWHTPFLVAFPESEAVDGLDWPLGSVVHLTIDDPGTAASPDFEQDGTMGQRPGIPGTHVRIDFEGEYDLKVGDLVTLTDGSTAQTHVVRNLTITAVDTGADTVAGTADPGAVVQVWAHGDDGVLEVTADQDGTWLADFSGMFDLVGGTDGRARVYDAAANATAVDWNIPNLQYLPLLLRNIP
jgi:hypothetical protein